MYNNVISANKHDSDIYHVVSKLKMSKS